ncbi:HEPN domain protein [Thermoproteus uzoniensis 768-20]|uniref:HEPN domain protein n=1 Tax=Thermoproteus uzoniensis (strain 768-20) TaxID=999630 RepID=F2L0N0_THEU7|nr:HEPN domain-containing protein [Thermoproteus uzoniensis]AEA11509.1 HEPN domain protein [Thermoproteus uzoniensis 768-20]
MTRLEEYEALVERSRRFYESATAQLERGFYDLAAFSLEQSLQLYLKAMLLKLGADYPRTHSVRRLLEMIHRLTGDAELQEAALRLSVELSLLEDAYITARYVPKEFTKEEVERLKKAVDEVRSVVGRAVDRRGQEEDRGT